MLSQGILEANSRGHVFPPGESATNIIDALLEIIIKIYYFKFYKLVLYFLNILYSFHLYRIIYVSNSIKSTLMYAVYTGRP